MKTIGMSAIKYSSQYGFILLIMVAALVNIFFLKEASSYSYERVFRTSDQKIISFGDMIAEMEGTDIIFVGEVHENEKHHEAQLDVIMGMASQKRPVSIALEMFKAETRYDLDLWVTGVLEEERFQEIYKEFWTVPWSLYEDIFVFSRNSGIPMTGLNVPKYITRKVTNDGIQSLTLQEMEMLPPDITCDDIDELYKNFIRKIYQTHAPHEEGFLYFCEAQMLWDKTMGWHLNNYINEQPEKTVVVIAGILHAWKWGIPRHMRNFSGYSFKVILPALPGIMHDKNIYIEDADYLLID